MNELLSAKPMAIDDDPLCVLQQQLDREHAARRRAEAVIAQQSLALKAAHQELASFAGVLEDRISERTEALNRERERALALSREDLLTGIANRRSHGTYLSEVCGAAQRGGSSVALFLIDIDNFKSINDGMGHGVGDQVLRLLARRLDDSSGSDHAARLGGDEFAFIAAGIADSDTAAAEAQRLLDVLCDPVFIDGRVIDISASIGFAVMPEHAATADELQRAADIALRYAKSGGRSRALGFDEKLRIEVDERRVLAAELPAALARCDVLPWFQPIVDATSHRVIGVEALARWIHPSRGMLSPSMFIPLAEEKSLMEPLFRSLLSQACQLLAPVVRAEGLSYVSLNASPSQFRNRGLAEAVQRVLAETGFPPEALVIEITEQLMVSNVRTAFRELSQLSKLGVRVALDDFGTGYSNIASLRKLPIDWLKLDRSLLIHVERHKADQAIVRAVLQMAQGLDVDVIAEGIETQGQADWLTAAGCVRQQGFFYSRPKPFEALLPMLVPGALSAG